MRSPLIFFSLLVLSLSLARTSNAQTISTRIQPGTPIERSINSSESHTYTITLRDEEYLQFVVVQRGIDLIVRVTSPSGKNLGDFDTPNGADGPENVAIVGLVGGLYQINVTALNPKAGGEGTYEIRTLEIRPATDQELRVAKGEDERRQKGLALLNDLINTIPGIPSPQTRLRVRFKTAVLLWSVDEKKATNLFAQGVNDIKEYVATLNPEADNYEPIYYGLQQLRYEAVQLLALNDPEAALTLLRSSRLRPPNASAVQGDQEQEDHFELSLASQIAAKDPKKAYELAQETLKHGLSSSLEGTLDILARQNAELASSLSRSIAAKLMEQKFLTNPQALELALSLITRSISSANQAQANPDNRTGSSLVSSPDLKALVTKILEEALNTQSKQNDLRGSYWTAGVLTRLRAALGDQIDSYMPGASVAIKNKLDSLGPEQPGQVWQRFQESIQQADSTETAKQAVDKAPPEIRSSLVQQLIQQTISQAKYAEAKQLILDEVKDTRGRQQALASLEREAALNDFRLGHTDDALRHVANVEPQSARALVIAEMASRMGLGQKRSQALASLETARSLVGASIQAEGQPQMSALLSLSGAFARYDSKRAFEILNPLVDQFNELSLAAKTLSGFGAEYFVDGELSLANGNSLSEITNSLRQTLGVVSFADFDGARLTADRLVLPEVKYAVILEIAQQAINPNGAYSPSAAYLNSRYR